jgi:hypothetical protein
MKAFLGAIWGTAIGGFIGAMLGLALGTAFVKPSFGADVVVLGCGVLGAFICAFFGVALGVYLAMKLERSEKAGRESEERP